MISLGLRQLDVWPIGKHKGKKMSELPLHYLQWAYMAELDPSLNQMVIKELNRRGYDIDSLIYEDSWAEPEPPFMEF